ncbi:MAG: hypothetical protein DRR42_07480 [Gammaproteobacteria bacterium]|nr:MAG: hypothetical protein DRR42_07480 [Gammaproteobacteria bacterium]
MTDWLGIEKLHLSPSKPDGYVPRPTASLLDRVKDHGPIEPVVVRPVANDKYEILANAETWVAAGRAGFHEVPVTIRDDIDEHTAQDIVQSYYGGTKGSAIDEAKHFEDQLAAFGGINCRGAVGKLAVAIGRSRPYIAHSLRLLTLPAEVQELIEKGVLSAGQARPLVSISNRANQVKAARTIIADKLTARAAEKLASNIRNGETTTKPEKTRNVTEKSADTRRFERQVSAVIGAQFSLENGRAIIDYSGSLDVLQGIVERLGYRES